MNNVCLASPLHDPKGLIHPILKQNGAKLKKIFGTNIAVSVTSETNGEVVSLLEELGFNIQISGEKSIGKHYRGAVSLALSLNTSFIHVIDFDRALHWADKYFAEFQGIEKQMLGFSGYISFIRSKRAFQTHPLAQTSTESVTNTIASKVAGVSVDIMSGSLGMERSFAEVFIKESKRDDFGFYAEPLMIAKKHNFPINTIEVEGLEWETPDQYQAEIAEFSYDGWLEKFQSLDEWEKRVKLLDQTTQVLAG